MSLLLDVVTSLSGSVVDYFVHGLTLRRILFRLFVGVLLCSGVVLMGLGSGTLAYVGMGLILLSGPLVLYDTATVYRVTRS